MLIVLHECSGLVQVVSREMVFQRFDLLWDDGDAVFAHDDTFHFDGANLGVPVVVADV